MIIVMTASRKYIRMKKKLLVEKKKVKLVEDKKKYFIFYREEKKSSRERLATHCSVNYTKSSFICIKTIPRSKSLRHFSVEKK